MSFPPPASVSGVNERSNGPIRAQHRPIEKQLVPQLIQLVLSPEFVWGNWNTAQLTSLSGVLLPTDSSEAIHAVLLSPTDRRTLGSQETGEVYRGSGKQPRG